VQHVFCAILEADRAVLKRVRDVRAYLVGAARNESMSYLRAERRRLARETARKTTAACKTERVDELAGAMSALPDEHREVLLLKAAGGLTFDQLALALGMNRSTAASRHRAALARLRELLDAHEDSTQDRNPPIMKTEAQHARS
jgi:RNA polymerase sigma factor (sigma-70 family)